MRRGAWWIGLGLILAACGGVKPSYTPEGPFWVELDRTPVSPPASRNPSLLRDGVDRSFIEQAEQTFDFDRLGRKLAGDPRQAYNINAYDEVPNSTWFTNRHGFTPMTPDEIRTADGHAVYPDTLGEWILSRPKVGGTTIGFWIEDRAGRRFIIKFDPPDYPEMATAAEVMGARYFYACGYNTPHSVIVRWHPEQLRIKEGVTFEDALGRKQPLTRQALDSILARAHRLPDGRFRSSASPLLPNVKGPFSYTGRRSDDPNDWCPHQHRRELRALYVPASLVNHYDTKDQNSLDIFVETEGERGYLEHYLIDFGSTFGSDGQTAKHPRKGYANWFDLKDIMVNWVSLGTKTWAWEKAQPCPYPSVGYFESDLFEPQKFDPIVPNPAFENMTDRDAYWGAKIVLAFEEQHIRAFVGAGELSNPEAEAYLVQTLLERREKIGRYWLARVNPLELVKSADSSTGLHVELKDLAVRYGFETAQDSRYRYRASLDGHRRSDWSATEKPVVFIERAQLNAWLDGSTARKRPDGTNLLKIEIETRRAEQNWSPPVNLYFVYNEERPLWYLVGIDHED